ncbi:protein strictosidine synthase-like 5 [Quercus suber]|uniref:Protein strictosidine synthase-like 5 n=1 Tax=Quercus suber TaxID=58331 RepID=A0AAW0IX17_QUESU
MIQQQKPKVLVRDLYVANGEGVENITYRQEKEEHADNIRYDGGPILDWIVNVTYTSMGYSIQIPLHPKDSTDHGEVHRKTTMEKNGGVLAIDLAGNPIAHYYDPGLALVTSAMKIGNHLYIGSFCYPYILRLNLKQYPAQAAT